MATKSSEVAVIAQQKGGALETLAARFGVEPNDLFRSSLKSVAFKKPDVSNEQLMALVVVANQYKLNPFTRELYAFPEKGGGIVPIVSVDGWFRIMNEHPEFDGMTYEELYDKQDKLDGGRVTIYRKDRKHPTVISEALSEVRRETDPWRQNMRRMLRHKTIIQGARIAFGFAGIYEPDEAERFIEPTRTVRVEGATGAQKVSALLGVGDEPKAVVPAVQPAPIEAPQDDQPL